MLLCIDDTDSIDSMGTGKLAQILRNELEERGWVKTRPITRHQLLLHKDIPYTSHNSSMCFEAEADKKNISKVIEFAQEFLVRECAPGSDPGLCVMGVEYNGCKYQKLINFGQDAKRKILTKEDAYQLAREMDIHLSEHGGTGQGVIGALAGVGLRLSGNDGRLRGSVNIASEGNIYKVKDLCAHQYIDMVSGLDGEIPGDEDPVKLEGEVKTVLLGNSFVLLVTPKDSPEEGYLWKNCTKQQLKRF